MLGFLNYTFSTTANHVTLSRPQPPQITRDFTAVTERLRNPEARYIIRKEIIWLIIKPESEKSLGIDTEHSGEVLGQGRGPPRAPERPETNPYSSYHRLEAQVPSLEASDTRRTVTCHGGADSS